MKVHGSSALGMVAVVALLLALISISCQFASIAPAANPSASQGSGSAAPAQPPASVGAGQSTALAASGDFRTAVRDVAAAVRPAVVQITNQQTQTGAGNSAFTVPAGVGSGVIYDNQGHILTNNHVVEGAQSLLVSLPDGRSFPGNLVGADPQTDLAVVQIQASSQASGPSTGAALPVAALGDSKQLQVGDWVVAIGNALALPGGPTVTAGTVSALNRTVQEPGGSPSGPGPGGSASTSSAGPFLFDVVQTDAPINPGNSGGPLVNLDGQVIGINTLVAGQAEPGVQAQGIGFAISINTAKPIADQLVATGKATHPYMGIGYVPLSPSIAASLGLKQTTGAVVQRVVSGSPAAAAGLQARDVITQIDGQNLQEESDLAKIINSHKPGDTVTLTVLRGSQTLTLQVKLVEMPTS